MADQMIADRARAAKAQALVAVLAQAGATSASVTYLDEDGWAWAAQAAGVRLPSQTTRDLVAFTLAERERLATVDPFAGLDDEEWAA